MKNFNQNDILINEIIRKNKETFNPLLNNSRNLDVIYKKMLNKELDPNCTNFLGNNVLFYCESLRDFKKFINLGASISHRNNKGKNLAFREKYIPYINKLIKDGDLIVKDIYDIKGNSAIFECSSLYIETMLEKGIDINHLNKNEENALFYSKIRETEILLKSGINPNVFNKKGMHPLFVSNINKILELLKNDVDINVLNKIDGNNLLFYIKDCLVIPFLIDKGINVNHLNNNNENALFYTYNIEVFKYLIESTNIDIHAINNNNENILFRKKAEKVKILLEKNIDTNIKNKIGKKAIYYISSQEILEIFLKYNIKIKDYIDYKGMDNITNNEKFTPKFKERLLELYSQEEKIMLKIESESKETNSLPKRL